MKYLLMYQWLKLIIRSRERGLIKSGFANQSSGQGYKLYVLLYLKLRLTRLRLVQPTPCQERISWHDAGLR